MKRNVVSRRNGEKTNEDWNRRYRGLSNRGKKRWKEVSMMQKWAHYQDRKSVTKEWRCIK